MRYKNNSAQDLWLPGVGEVKAGAEVTTDGPLNNANFSLVEEKERPKAPAKNEAKSDEQKS